MTDILVTPTTAPNSTNALMERLWLSTARQLFFGTKVRLLLFQIRIQSTSLLCSKEKTLNSITDEVRFVLYYSSAASLYTDRWNKIAQITFLHSFCAFPGSHLRLWNSTPPKKSNFWFISSILNGSSTDFCVLEYFIFRAKKAIFPKCAGRLAMCLIFRFKF